MSTRAEVSRIEIDSDGDGLSVEITVRRVPGFFYSSTPPAADVPEDIRNALATWLREVGA